MNALDQDTSSIQWNTNENGGISVFVPKPGISNLAEVMNSKLAPDVEFIQNPRLVSDFGKFSYIHKRKDGRDIYYFANSSDEKVETDVLLRGELDLEEWDPHEGRITRGMNTESLIRNGQTYTKISLGLDPVKSVFYISR
jgi:hypothetical protein